MMPTKKKQHFVPKLYMRNFSDGKIFNIYIHSNNMMKYGVGFKNQCQENYYYGIDLEWENTLGQIEKAYSDIIYKTIMNKKYFPNDSEVEVIKKFIVFQRQRGTFMEHESKNVRWALKASIAKLVAINKLKMFPTEEAIEQLKVMNYDIDSLQVVKTNLENAMNFPSHISDLSMSIIRYVGETKLISSDNPVVFYNAYNQPDIGLDHAGLIIMLPITPDTLIVFYDGKMYKEIPKLSCVRNENEVMKLNSIQFIVSKDILFFRDKETEKNVRKIILKYRKKRDHFQNRKTSFEFGTDKDKVVLNQNRYIDDTFNFSFITVTPRASRFSLVVKDWIFREESGEYIERMENRLSMMQSGLFDGVDRKHKREMKHFMRFVYDYWNNIL